MELHHSRGRNRALTCRHNGGPRRARTDDLRISSHGFVYSKLPVSTQRCLTFGGLTETHRPPGGSDDTAAFAPVTTARGCAVPCAALVPRDAGTAAIRVPDG